MANPFLNVTDEAWEQDSDRLVAREMYQAASNNINVLAVQSQVNQNNEYGSNITFEYRYHPYKASQGVYVWRKYVMEWDHARGPLYVGIARGAALINEVRELLEAGEDFELKRGE